MTATVRGTARARIPHGPRAMPAAGEGATFDKRSADRFNWLRMPLPWRRALVVGASSGIGAAIARRRAQAGARVALVARRADELARVAGEIEARGAGTAVVRVHDVRRAETVPALSRDVCDALGGLDLVVYAAGVMPRIREDEY